MTTHNYDTLITLLQHQRATIQMLNTMEVMQGRLQDHDLHDARTVCKENANIIKLVDATKLTEEAKYYDKVGELTIFFTLNNQKYILALLINEYCKIITK